VPTAKFLSGPFAGVPVHDTFALAALNETPVVVNLPRITFPDNLGPAVTTFANHTAGSTITTAINDTADVLILLYTDLEISALLDVFTNNSSWTPARKKTWYGYGHNFAQFKPLIKGGEDNALEAGIFGYLLPLVIGSQRVVLFKTELHPKNNGNDVPFIPVIKQLVSELQPKLVISTGTAGAIGSHLQCGDVSITSAARLHCRNHYTGALSKLNTMTAANTEMKNTVEVNGKYITYAANNFTKLSLPGLQECYGKIGSRPEYSFLKKNTAAPSIYVKGVNPGPGPQPTDIVSGDYLTVDDDNNSEGLQPLGLMNDTDDAFAFFAIDELPAAQRPKWLSIRNASEPQIVVPPFPAGTTPTQVIDKLKSVAGAIYGVYQYCTTLNSAFACWGVVAGLN
jgi:hypothetical protein